MSLKKIYKKRINSLNADAVSIDKIKEEIEDAYAKGKRMRSIISFSWKDF
ncbi:MAG: hypothetical protein WBZ36_30725 [Candidatus Nitrosopolaris sp.]